MERLRDFLLETRIRLGARDLPGERLLWAGIRDAKTILGSPRRLVGALVVIAMVSVSLPAQDASSVPTTGVSSSDVGVGGTGVPTVGYPVFDAANSAWQVINNSEASIRQELREVWDENRENTQWVTDLVQTYRTIKMAKMMYQSLATFDLAQNLNIVDVLPTVPLQEGFIFGGPSNGFSAVASASGNGEATMSMPALQFQSRKGGALSTFSDWGKFKPNLNINPQNLEEQLANIDFDCVQMTQRIDAQGNVVAEAIKAGDPQAAYGQVFGWFNSLMQSINNWSQQGIEQQQASAALNQRILQDTANFEHNVQNLQNACDQQDQISSQMWSGLGISKPASVDSTYNICYAPKISNLQKLMDSRATIEQQELTLRYQDLTARKTNNADVQVAGTNFAEMVRIETENQKIIDSAQAAWAALYGKYKTLRTDPGEKDGNSIIGMLSLSSVDLEDMKIPPAGIQEFERLQRDVANQLAANQTKLNALNVKTDRIQLADQSISKHMQEQQDMLDAYKRMQDDYIGQDALNASMVNESYIENVAATEAQQRADDEKAAMALSQNIQNANDKFFTFFNSTQRSAALNILPTLINDYFSIVKAFFTGQSLSDVMGNNGLGAAGNVNITAEWQLYQSLINGGNS